MLAYKYFLINWIFAFKLKFMNLNSKFHDTYREVITAVLGSRCQQLQAFSSFLSQAISRQAAHSTCPLTKAMAWHGGGSHVLARVRSGAAAWPGVWVGNADPGTGCSCPATSQARPAANSWLATSCCPAFRLDWKFYQGTLRKVKYDCKSVGIHLPCAKLSILSHWKIS